MSRASEATFEIVSENGVLSDRRLEVYTALWQHERERAAGLTHNEISKYVAALYGFPENYRNNTVARLCELEKQGVVENTGDMKCPLSGYPASTWRTLNRTPNDYVRPKPERFWIVIAPPNSGRGGLAFRFKRPADSAAKKIKKYAVEVIEVIRAPKRKKQVIVEKKINAVDQREKDLSASG